MCGFALLHLRQGQHVGRLISGILTTLSLQYPHNFGAAPWKSAILNNTEL